MRPGAGSGSTAAAARGHRLLREHQGIVSRPLLADILDSKEEHIDWIETQLSLVDRVG